MHTYVLAELLDLLDSAFDRMNEILKSPEQRRSPGRDTETARRHTMKNQKRKGENETESSHDNK
jgi:hypothetical protein